MIRNKTNPFNITQAKDFNDKQILDFWVDITGEAGSAGFDSILKPRSLMPMLLLGSKGSGKTHLMRYYSSVSQAFRHKDNVPSGLAEDGYFGIYVKMGSLNTQKFKGKDRSDDYWMKVFAYFMDLWLGQILLDCCIEAYKGHKELSEVEASICQEIMGLFTHTNENPPSSLHELKQYLSGLQNHLDQAINDVSTTHELEVDISANPGALIFGLPKILRNHLDHLRNCTFVYLLDELENISESQQIYINTLVKEKENPSTFKIGARLYGHRTYLTLCADEELVKDSEYEEVRLDNLLRENSGYPHFAMKLMARRLIQHDFLPSHFELSDELDVKLEKFFESVEIDELEQKELDKIKTKYSESERPYFSKLRSQLTVTFSRRDARGVRSKEQIDDIIAYLSCSEAPLLEKVNVFLFYRAWKDDKDLIQAAREIGEDCNRYIDDQSQETAQNRVLEHFKSDLLAQLRKDCALKQHYGGLKRMIEMSWGVPRSFLVLLKHTFDRAIFKCEDPFGVRKISAISQEDGIRLAAEWFHADAKIKGKDGDLARDSIHRLATLFRSVRFSNKPTECSLVVFSADLSTASKEARRMIKLCCDYSLLIEFSTRQNRNSMRIDNVYQLNRMLAPRWDLPIFKGGDLFLDGRSISIIFDHQFMCENFGIDPFLKQIIAPMSAPNFGRNHQVSDQTDIFE